MKKINSADIAKLGQLAQLGLAPAEISKMQTQLGEILGYVAKLQAVDTAKTKPTSQVTGLVDVWRKDEAYAKAWDRDELLKNAPQSQDGYIKVKKVI